MTHLLFTNIIFCGAGAAGAGLLEKRLKTAHANIIPTNHVRRRARVMVRVRVRVRVRVNMQLFQQSNVRQCHA